MRLRSERRTPEWRLGPGADFRSLSRHNRIIKGWSLDKMFTCLEKPEVFTLASWSPFIPSCPPGDQRPLSSGCWQSCSVPCLHPELAWYAWLCVPVWFPMPPLDLTPNAGSEKLPGTLLRQQFNQCQVFSAPMKGDETLLWSISLWQWFASLPTTLLHTPRIRCPQGPPDAVSFLRFLADMQTSNPPVTSSPPGLVIVFSGETLCPCGFAV